MALNYAWRTAATLALAEPAQHLKTVSIIGLGYVGVVSVGCLAGRGFKVIGADLDAAKVAMVAGGKSPIVEKGLGELLDSGVKSGLVAATVDVAQAVRDSDVTLLERESQAVDARNPNLQPSWPWTPQRRKLPKRLHLCPAWPRNSMRARRP